MNGRTLTLLLVPTALLGAHALAFTISAVAGEGCDLEKVERAFYCEADKLVLGKKELVSKKPYYECPGCKGVSKKSGKCEFCEKKRVKKVSEKEVCPQCYVKPVSVEACAKNGYACPKCGESSAKPAKCADCRVKHKKVVSRALVAYRCSECRKEAYEPGSCANPECGRQGQALVRTCSKSGKPPHVKKDTTKKK